MLENRRSSTSIYDVKHKLPRKESLFQRKIICRGNQFAIGIITGFLLTIVTIILYCVAFFTPHWKVVSPTTNSFYVTGADALIRTEVQMYFYSVHQSNQHTYGLFQRCEYPSKDNGKFVEEKGRIASMGVYTRDRICTKNFLPSYEDEHFNECHSLRYYRFCSNNGERNFDINSDHRATFSNLSSSPLKIGLKPSCACYYPTYVKVCHVLGVLTLISLCFTAFLFGLFPFVQTRHCRLQTKCGGILSALFSMIFILSSILVALDHLQYEPIEYLVAIEKHYKSIQIYKLSSDAKHAIDQFLTTINIHVGYSTIIAWISFVLSILDGIIMMTACKISFFRDDAISELRSATMDTPKLSTIVENEEINVSITPLRSAPDTNDDQDDDANPSGSFKPLPVNRVGQIHDTDENFNEYPDPNSTCLKQTSHNRNYVEDEV